MSQLQQQSPQPQQQYIYYMMPPNMMPPNMMPPNMMPYQLQSNDESIKYANDFLSTISTKLNTDGAHHYS